MPDPTPDLVPKPMAGKYDGRRNNGKPNFGKKMRKLLLKKTLENAIISLDQIVSNANHRNCFDACKFVIEQGIGRAPFAADDDPNHRQPIDNRLQVAIQSLIVNQPRQPQPDVTRLLPEPSNNVTSSDPSRREDPPVE